jgi:imidazoleglycerol phosphate dehydratase HisB
VLKELQSHLISHVRQVNGTQISVSLNLNGHGTGQIQTKINFLDHLLDLFSRQGQFDLKIDCQGDSLVYDYHYIDEIGVTLGQAFSLAIEGRESFQGSGFSVQTTHECLTTAAINFSERYAFQLSAEFNHEKVGDLATDLIFDFWDAFAQNTKSSLIIKSEFGRNDYHKVEGIFQATAKAIHNACQPSLPNTAATAQNPDHAET